MTSRTSAQRTLEFHTTLRECRGQLMRAKTMEGSADPTMKRSLKKR
jgi:hypothetical protein